MSGGAQAVRRRGDALAEQTLAVEHVEQFELNRIAVRIGNDFSDCDVITLQVLPVLETDLRTRRRLIDHVPFVEGIEATAASEIRSDYVGDFRIQQAGAGVAERHDGDWNGVRLPFCDL